MAIEKCINEFDVGHVIFEEGSTGRELFVVLDGEVEIAKINGANKTVIVTLGKGEFFGEMAVIDGSSRSDRVCQSAADTERGRQRAARIWSRAICGLVLNTTSSGTPALARRTGSAAQSSGR